MSAASHPRRARSGEGGRDHSGSTGPADVKVPTSVLCLTQVVMNVLAKHKPRLTSHFQGPENSTGGEDPMRVCFCLTEKGEKENVFFHDVSKYPVRDHHLFVMRVVLLTFHVRLQSPKDKSLMKVAECSTHEGLFFKCSTDGMPVLVLHAMEEI